MNIKHKRHYAGLAEFYRTLRNNLGQTLIEYVLIIVVISIALITAMSLFQGGLNTTYSNAASSFPRAP